MLTVYRKSLQFALRHHLAVSLSALIMALATVWMFIKAPKRFLPNEDTGRILISTEAEQGIAFDRMVELQQKAAGIVSHHPAVEDFMSRIGGGSSASSANTGRLFLSLSHVTNARQLMSDPPASKDLSGIPGLKVFPQNPPPFALAAP